MPAAKKQPPRSSVAPEGWHRLQILIPMPWYLALQEVANLQAVSVSALVRSVLRNTLGARLDRNGGDD